MGKVGIGWLGDGLESGWGGLLGGGFRLWIECVK